MNKYRQYPYSPKGPSRLEKILGYALAAAIGIGLAGLLVAWWSS